MFSLAIRPYATSVGLIFRSLRVSVPTGPEDPATAAISIPSEKGMLNFSPVLDCNVTALVTFNTFVLHDSNPVWVNVIKLSPVAFKSDKRTMVSPWLAVSMALLRVLKAFASDSPSFVSSPLIALT